MMLGSSQRVLFTLACLSELGKAYIPALPTNDSAAVKAGVNESDTSMLKLQWYVLIVSLQMFAD